MQSQQFSLLHRPQSGIGLNKLALMSQHHLLYNGGDDISLTMSKDSQGPIKIASILQPKGEQSVAGTASSTSQGSESETLDGQVVGMIVEPNKGMPRGPLSTDLHLIRVTSNDDLSVNSTDEQSSVDQESRDMDSAPSSTMNPPQEGDVADVEGSVATRQEDVEESVTPQPQSQQVGVPLDSRELNIDRSLFVGDALRVIEVGVYNNYTELIQFTGPIGSESRSISTSKPLPKPQVFTQEEPEEMGTQEEKVFKPFVCPFLDTTDQVSSIPRLVSYYEIEVNKNPLSFEKRTGSFLALSTVSSEEGDDEDDDVENEAVWDEPCIAIGLAGSNFPMKDTMPGWKRRSYGYHSDDGSVWESRTKVADYGDKFGVGDAIGCGLDYRTSTIFYTLNGKFLGLSSTLNDYELSMDWYPTVGLDSNDYVACNFGYVKSFKFDLVKYCQDEPPTAPTSEEDVPPEISQAEPEPQPTISTTTENPEVEKKATEEIRGRRRFRFRRLRHVMSSFRQTDSSKRKRVMRWRSQ